MEESSIFSSALTLVFLENRLENLKGLIQFQETQITKNLEEKDGQTQLLCYVSLIRACNKVL